ncbi:TlpA disulfide reductase family protein [Alteribacter keqinensis]|uniref:TlpA family protein disulfide reductase n=1 Tax=Alteribacter keqinensis TaxID=2483800 RepID=A0A3M7TU83_9BACI|nr:TlpA disulfide reductase family protein [Alteribacter keqinensis]RNA69198.1 TlpA family protein disulfide reductase [Alteribacter keqinensis]
MKAPELNVYNPETNDAIILKDYEGKALLLTFWVSWCPDSKRDFPNKEQLYKAMETKELDLLMVNVKGREGEPDAGMRYYEENGFTVPMGVDNGTKTYDSYRCMSVPTTFLLNKNHEIAASFNDKATFQDILTSLSRVL